MVRSDALKYFQKHAAAQVSQCCWLAYNLIIMTINVAGSWNFHLDIIAASAVLVLTMLSLAFNLGITANTAPAGIHSTRPVAILKQKNMVFKNWFLGPELV